MLSAAAVATRRLMSWGDNTEAQNYFYIFVSCFLVLFAGCMSGLTLGLCSIDKMELEVLKRSGTPQEQKWAMKVAPIVENTHVLLVTLLLGNACAMEALPLFLDRLANPVMAIIISVTAVLFFGEIIPQSICTRYGLQIGARMAWFVRMLMWVAKPVVWPIAKLLDFLLGAENHSLFRRKQLKALVDIHAEDTGMGGKLTTDEIKVITGALDLTNKIAYKSMTLLDNVFMLSTDDKLDEPTLRAILNSGHSRIPVHRSGNRSDLVGLILVKELLQYKMSQEVPVCMLKMRSLPRLSASTPMYDMLKLFQTGRSHMAVLTQPPPPSPPSPPPSPPQLHQSRSVPLKRSGSRTERTASASSTKAEEAEPSTSRAASSPFEKDLDYAQEAASGRQRRSLEQARSAGRGGSKGASRVVTPEQDEGRDTDAEAEAHERTGSGQFSLPGAADHGIPMLAAPGEPIGIITIEDVIEELIRSEIVDETDIYVDNEHRVRVNQATLTQNLPERLHRVLSGNLRGGSMMSAQSAVSTIRSTLRSARGAKPSSDMTQPLLSPE